MQSTRNRWSIIVAASALAVVGAGATEAAQCPGYADRRLAHFEALAQRAVRQCVRRAGDACPDAPLTKRLDATAERIARNVARRCPETPVTDALASARARALCDLADVCGPPRRITVSVGREAASTGARTPSEHVLHANAGWTGLAHGLAILEGAAFTAALDDCDGESDTLCTLRGATAGRPFGAPSPLGAGGVTFCVDVGFQSDVTGAYDLASGALTYDAAVSIDVYNGSSIDQPCPACVPADGEPALGDAGTCAGGPNAGTACVVEGLGDPAFGALRGTSRVCGAAFAPAGRIAHFSTRASATTGAFEMAPASDGPRCNDSPFIGQICPCSTCDDAGQRACHSDSECTRPDGTTGRCGGRRCIGGPNDGTPCTAQSACTGGFCSTPHAILAPNSCLDQTCTPTGDADGGGLCLEGPIDTVCAVARHRGCLSDADCPAGDHCTTDVRRCHPDVVALEGEASPAANGVAAPTLVGGFCMAPAGQMAVNVAAGFPGLVTYVWPTEVELGR